MRQLPLRWAVKNDGSQLFIDTVVKYVNQTYRRNWEGTEINKWYGVSNGNPLVTASINMECITPLDLDVFVEEYLPTANNTINDLSEGWLIKGDLFDTQGMELINKYYRTFGSLGSYHRVDDSYYGFATKPTNSILYYSNSGDILNSPYHFTIIQDFETIRPLLEKAIQSVTKTLPAYWSVECKGGVDSDPRFTQVLDYIKEKTGRSYGGIIGYHYGMNGDNVVYYSLVSNTTELSVDEFLDITGHNSNIDCPAPTEQPTKKELPSRWVVKNKG